ncbi:MAG: hypothetical protein M3406_02950 [Chloroflexota bacterium]|nr:hypothetical protein [Chloroflexota bacterium]
MSDWRVAAVVAGAIAILAVTSGLGWLLFAPGILIVLVAWLNARDWSVYERDPWDLPSTAPKVAEVSAPCMDLDDELGDLLRSARDLATRLLEDDGRLEPFVMFEDGDGEFRVRKVAVDGGADGLARGRAVARQVDPSAPRVVLVVPGVLDFAGKARPSILFEAGEHLFQARTLAFAQLYRPKRLMFPAAAEGRTLYLGEALHSLRFAPSAASFVRMRSD